MTIYLRQICLVAEKLGPAVEQLSQVFSLYPCHVDPAVEKFGLENTLFTIGTNFLEVIAPVRENTAAGRFLEKQGGEKGYMVICQARSKEEQSALRKRAAANSVRVAYEADHDSWNIMQLHPADMGAAFLEVDWDEAEDTEGNWEPAGGSDWKDKRQSNIALEIAAVEILSSDPKKLAEHWAAVIGIPVDVHGDQFVIPLPNARLLFSQNHQVQPDHLAAIDLYVSDLSAVQSRARECDTLISDNQVLICGTIFRLIERKGCNNGN